MAKKAKLTRLRIYPVKGLEGMDVNAWELDSYGLRFDRRWMVVDASSHCITRREYPKLAAVRAEIEGDMLVLSAPHQPPLEVPTDPEPGPTEPATIRGDTVAVREPSDDASRWLREWLRAACRLVFLPEPRHRSVAPALGTREAHLAFQDELPIQLLRAESLEELNGRLEEDVSVEAVRANLLIEGAGAAYEEDTWRRIRIGEVELQVVKPWPHATIVRPDGDAAAGTGPDAISELAGYRGRGGELWLGQLAIPSTTVGLLRVGDVVEVLERGDAPSFSEEVAEPVSEEVAEPVPEEPAAEPEPDARDAQPAPARKGGIFGKKVRLDRLPTLRDPEPARSKKAEADPAPAAPEPDVAEPDEAESEETAVDEVLAAEPPVEEMLVEEVLTEEPPVEEEASEEEAAEAAPVEEAPVEEAPVEEAPAEEAPVEEAPAEEAASARSLDSAIEVTADQVPALDETVRLLAAAAVAEGTGETRRLAEACLRAPLLVTAWKDDALVGLLRGWTDDVRDGFIADVAVHPDQHGSGVAQELVGRVMALHPDIRWVLRASPGSAYLGSALGWQHAGSGWYLSPR